jgi:hypothetical protein
MRGVARSDDCGLAGEDLLVGQFTTAVSLIASRNECKFA